MQEVKIMESRISIKDGKNVVVFKVEGDFDNLLCIKYKNVLTEILARKRCDLVVFDLSLVSFIDSSGIGLLLGRYKQVKEYQGDIVICGVNKQIKKKKKNLPPNPQGKWVQTLLGELKYHMPWGD